MTIGTIGTTVKTVMAGNVGIGGTTAPSAALDVAGVITTRGGSSQSTNGWTDVSGGTTTTTGGVFFRNPDGSIQASIGNVSATKMDINVVTNKALTLATGNTERLRIDSSGNVGIGTSTPAATLDVSGITTLRGTLDVSGVTTLRGLNMSNTNIANAGTISAAVLYGRLPALAVVSTSSIVNTLMATGFSSADNNDTLSLVVNFKVSPAGNYNMQLYINGDTTATNYWTEYTQDYTIARANSAMFMQSGGSADNEMFMKFIICRSRISGGHIVKGEGGFHAKTSSTGSNIQHWTCLIWHNSDTDITSLTIGSTTGNILGPAAMRVYPW